MVAVAEIQGQFCLRPSVKQALKLTQWQDIMVRGETGRWWIAEKRLVVDGWDPKGWYAMMFDQV